MYINGFLNYYFNFICIILLIFYDKWFCFVWFWNEEWKYIDGLKLIKLEKWLFF